MGRGHELHPSNSCPALPTLQTGRYRKVPSMNHPAFLVLNFSVLDEEIKPVSASAFSGTARSKCALLASDEAGMDVWSHCPRNSWRQHSQRHHPEHKQGGDHSPAYDNSRTTPATGCSPIAGELMQKFLLSTYPNMST